MRPDQISGGNTPQWATAQRGTITVNPRTINIDGDYYQINSIGSVQLREFQVESGIKSWAGRLGCLTSIVSFVVFAAVLGAMASGLEALALFFAIGSGVAIFIAVKMIRPQKHYVIFFNTMGRSEPVALSDDLDSMLRFKDDIQHAIEHPPEVPRQIIAPQGDVIFGDQITQSGKINIGKNDGAIDIR